MKKTLALALALALALTLAACGSNSNSGNNNTPSSNPTNSPSGSPANSPSSNPTEAPNNSGSNDTGEAWPDTWPSDDIPKIDGTVDYVYDGGIDTLTGITVNVTVQDDGVATAYVENLVSSGFELVNEVKLDGGFNKTYKGKGYSSIVCIYSEEDNFFSLFITKYEKK